MYETARRYRQTLQAVDAACDYYQANGSLLKRAFPPQLFESRLQRITYQVRDTFDAPAAWDAVEQLLRELAEVARREGERLRAEAAEWERERLKRAEQAAREAEARERCEAQRAQQRSRELSAEVERLRRLTAEQAREAEAREQELTESVARLHGELVRRQQEREQQRRIERRAYGPEDV